MMEKSAVMLAKKGRALSGGSLPKSRCEYWEK
jgi:hypothetical protein